jgi:hypothetical protein
MARSTEYQRLILGLSANSRDYAAVGLMAEFADLIGVDLFGIFANDELMRSLVALPSAREFGRSGWQPVDVSRTEQQASRAASEARRLFLETIKSYRAHAHFDVATGLIGDIVSSRSGPGDIVAVIEPANPAERITHQFTHLLNAVLGARSAALLVPSRIAHRKGPVIAVASRQQDGAADLALKLAELAHERLILLVPPDAHAPSVAKLIARSKIPIDQHKLAGANVTRWALESLLQRACGRLLVVDRDAATERPDDLSFGAATPMLITPGA